MPPELQLHLCRLICKAEGLVKVAVVIDGRLGLGKTSLSTLLTKSGCFRWVYGYIVWCAWLCVLPALSTSDYGIVALYLMRLGVVTRLTFIWSVAVCKGSSPQQCEEAALARRLFSSSDCNSLHTSTRIAIAVLY
jgi:hypothetical protein